MTKRNNRQLDHQLLDHYGKPNTKLKGDVLYSPKHPKRAVFYLTDGYVRLVNQEQGVIKIVGPGEFFGDRGIFASDKIYTEAITDIKYICMDESVFRWLMYKDTKLALEITTSLSQHAIYLKQRPNLLTITKEIYSHMRKGHALKYFIVHQRATPISCK
ncbi:Crp/Fnr family transcriptional regulator [Aquibacillus sediminis]|uniref:Crp/Fnr family transcriptional regulator n=1 Tax=Aquibacillus sediminis TaxID=2574734 RepID=UPI001487088A|nr:cyclic nucleotide-binding domain-containing protein [Aquibacillus sediminis]